MALTSTFGTVPVAISGTAETIIGSTPFLTFVPGGAPSTYQGMVVRGVISGTLTTNSVGFTARVRQGTAITGTLVGGIGQLLQTGMGTGATVGFSFPFEVLDTSASPATQYTVSVLGSVAATAGAALNYEIETDPDIP